MNKIKKQIGFALIEVMIAALVMVVGSLGFLRLQQISLQSSFNNYARSEGTVLANGFMEQLRSNVLLLRSSSSAFQGEITKDNEAADENNCHGNKICKLNLSALRKQINRKGAVLCYREQAAGTGYMRITYMWQDNSEDGRNAGLNCPTFEQHTNANNSVTIYAQL